MATRYTAKELTLLPPTNPSDWIVEGIFRTNRKRPSLLCGFPEAGKSTLAHQLAVAVAHGTSFLGRSTEQGYVVYWKNEDSEQDVAEDFRKAGMTQDTSLSILLPSPGDNNFRELNAELELYPETKLVIIETLSDFLQVQDITSNDDCRTGLQRFYDTIMKPHPDCVYVMLHHFNKSDMKGDLSITRILGGTTIAGGTDSKIYLSQVSDSDSRRTIHAATRKGKSIEPTYLVFDPATLTSTLGDTVKQESITNRSIVKTQKLLDVDAKIQQMIYEHPGTSKWQLVASVGGNSMDTGRHIEEMIQSGLIIAKQGGGKGSPQRLYLPGTELATAVNAGMELIQ